MKYVKQQQKKNPVSEEKYQKRLRVARKKDNMRRLRNFFIILAVLVLALFIGGNVMLKKATGQTLFGCMKEAKELVDESTPETFRLAQTSYIYSDDGTQLAALSEDVDATYLEYDQIPADVVNAFVAVEDRTFWKEQWCGFQGNCPCLFKLRQVKRTGGRRCKYDHAAAGAWYVPFQRKDIIP